MSSALVLSSLYKKMNRERRESRSPYRTPDNGGLRKEEDIAEYQWPLYTFRLVCIPEVISVLLALIGTDVNTVVKLRDR